MTKNHKPDSGSDQSELEKRKTLWSTWKQVMLGNNENQGENSEETAKPKEDQPPFWWI
ncbi:hypothetical protein [Alteribacter lacisalsi]|uniref:hypothetical protein n=1 Tax=Alteribacter lacisalsi TaxID=2045244 RepID=UPI001374F41E|nr:hypothetical protein [Alteribacter lacisalsi]